jgi:hypothetical protein
MAKRKEMTFIESTIHFPRAAQKKGLRRLSGKTLFKRLTALTKRIEGRPRVEVVSDRENNTITLDSDEFMFMILCEDVPSIRIMIHDPKKHIEIVNKIGNRLISYMNDLLGDRAKGSGITFIKTTFSKEKTTNLSKRIIGETRMVRINEIVGLTLIPISVSFDYKSGDKHFIVATISNGQAGQFLLSKRTYRNSLPIDVLRKEYEDLNDPQEVLNKLLEVEL